MEERAKDGALCEVHWRGNFAKHYEVLKACTASHIDAEAVFRVGLGNLSVMG